jgi:acyl transferase domain-containing protein/thioesterase domain-containing protein
MQSDVNEEKRTMTGMEIAIIGMSGRLPGAENIDRFWDNLKNGLESITFFTDEELQNAGIPEEEINNPDYIYVKAKGILENIETFDSSFFNYTPKEAAIMDPQVRVFHECAWEAMENSGYDSWAYDGLIGLYSGATTNLYWMVNALLFQQDRATSIFENGLLNNSDYLNTRVAYKLNLKGPAVMVHTACSTSLVAVHMAVQALLMGECEMALAGGVTISLPWKTGYIYQDGMVKSPDGHCRAFDEKAQGFVNGNGIGIVVLKRLEEAAADGDYIHAVILGSAVNNDGIGRIGYTAPSVEGQSAVIRAAYQMAEVEPASIGYIETHGTGTPLGDPIEIEALKRAFNTNGANAENGKHSCALGSVKTNVGHLDSAAGVAGLIKTVLALEHRLIPPSLYFDTPNPNMAIENSPFYVNRRLTRWESNGGPLRAGVSSFGIGGTNVHMVLEQAPGNTPTSPSRQSQLILLSAKTKTALNRVTLNLTEYLKQNPDVSLPDVAFTLQQGRRAFSHKRMMVCSKIDEAVEALSSTNSGTVRYHFTNEEDKPVVFMFPGLGSQYVNMGLDLYNAEPLFRRETDRCFEILDPMLGVSIKDILYPAGDSTAGAEKIHRIEFSQLAVFIFEYALTQLLMTWGIKPHAMIGYSFGEYTAACISGVFSLEDVLQLLVSRGKLLSRIPAGAMISVPLPEEKLKPLLFGDLSIAIDNGVSCIVSGSNESIDTLEKQMKEKRLLCVRLKASRGIHSLMMDSILEEFEAAVNRITLHKPQIPYLSNLTGKWITVEDATSPGYWANHMRETVRFAAGLEELLKIENAALLEIGPGVVLSTLAMPHIGKKSDQVVVNVLRSEEQRVSDVEYLLKKIGLLWLYGKKMDWTAFYSEEKRKRLPLPTYPFAARRFPVDMSNLIDLINGKMPEAAPLALYEDEPTETVEPEPEEDYVAPRDKAERMIVDLWEKILGIKPIGIHQNFFEMGGDSLKGIDIVNKFQVLFGEIIHITVIFDAPTVAELVDYFKKHYPQGYAKMMDMETAGDKEQPEEEITPEKFDLILSQVPLILPLGEITGPKNPPAVFILSPPRTGSTLLRIMMAGHPRIFAPPELNLMQYETLAERKELMSGRSELHLQGTLRAVMQIENCSAEKAEEVMQDFEDQGMTVKQFYRQMQHWLEERNQLLADKSPGYSLYPEVMKRIELYFQDPLYIFLVRHPYGMIRSYIDAKMDLLMKQEYVEKIGCSRRQIAELTWTIRVKNIKEFLKNVPENRQLLVRYEDLVAAPEHSARQICEFLNLEFAPEMLQPYKEKKQRMTDAVYSKGIMLGDMKFHQHKKIDPTVADSWRKDYTADFLGQPTWKFAKPLGYKSIRELQNDSLIVEDKNLVLLEKKAEGNKNLFLIHDRSGNVDTYIEFCRHMNSGFNCWGIQADQLEDLIPRNWQVEKMVQKYIQTMKKVQHQGPYFIAGWSFGGTASFEMARQLEQRGEKIAFCALIDTPHPSDNTKVEDLIFTPETELRFLKRFLGEEIEEIFEKTDNIEDIWSRAVEHLKAENFDLKKIELLIRQYDTNINPDYSRVDIDYLIRHLNLGRTLFNTRAAYIPTEKINTPLHFFWGNQSTRIIKEHWSTLCSQPIRFHEINGDHFSIFKKPNVVGFAQKFKKALQDGLSLSD